MDFHDDPETKKEGTNLYIMIFKDKWRSTSFRTNILKIEPVRLLIQGSSSSTTEHKQM
jgi:hypothetical protein